MAEATIALGPLGQIALTVADLAAATEFYRERLGLPFLFAAPNLAFFDCGGVRLMLATPERGEAVAQGATLYFTVGDIHAAHRALAERGVPFVDAYRPLLGHDQWDSDLAASTIPGHPGQAGYGLIAWLVLNGGWREWLDL